MLLIVQWPAWVRIGRWALAAATSLPSASSSSLALPEVSVWLQALMVLFPLAIYMTLLNAIFAAWTAAELERLLRRSVGSPATNWTVTFTLMLVLTLAAAIDFVRPIAPWLMAAITAVVALAITWLARRLHVRRVNERPPALR